MLKLSLMGRAPAQTSYESVFKSISESRLVKRNSKHLCLGHVRLHKVMIDSHARKNRGVWRL